MVYVVSGKKLTARRWFPTIKVKNLTPCGMSQITSIGYGLTSWRKTLKAKGLVILETGTGV